MLRKILLIIVIAIVGYILINRMTARVVVNGVSMESTLYSGQLLLISRFHYQLGEPQRGDIVVFYPEFDPTQEYIKRVLGLPGETLELRDGRVYINGQLWDEPYVTEACEDSICYNSIWQVGTGEYFVMGDNRNASRDSRSFGTIPQDAIIGKAILRYWSLSEMAWLD
ncbi:MAG: signal peptidase I [Anaerolineae bacterium]|nr:signal peptidase I [Anaerolineae bacterium]MDQ7037111.1 signal peptidase I [Anaerolineae bacterium]